LGSLPRTSNGVLTGSMPTSPGDLGEDVWLVASAGESGAFAPGGGMTRHPKVGRDLPPGSAHGIMRHTNEESVFEGIRSNELERH